MSIYVYPTDLRWFRFLQARSPLDEVNFWQPGGATAFKALSPGDLFLFRLKSPVNKIAGGGTFATASLYPLSGAWDAFGLKNGVASFSELFSAISGYRSKNGSAPANPDTQIGCIVLAQPFFLPESEWIDTPSDYHLSLVQGKSFSLASDTGKRLHAWGTLQHQASVGHGIVSELRPPMFGALSLRPQRLGQGAFRLIVSDAYAKRCSVTGEKTLPVLEAAHIRPVAHGGEHNVENGLLLRSDLHKLFDLGYATVMPSGQFRVSQKLRETWTNGRVYYELDGAQIRRTQREQDQPSPLLLEWHNDTIFRG